MRKEYSTSEEILKDADRGKVIHSINIRKSGSRKYNVVLIKDNEHEQLELAKKRDTLIDKLNNIVNQNKWAILNDGHAFDISLEITKIEIELKKTCKVLDHKDSEEFMKTGQVLIERR
tara:strand:- start:812 stop:1165 length:354 start_codon:yes stop_codon:yes gene_type:complete